MKLSTRTRYGTRAMAEIALNYGKGTTYIQDVAKKQNISFKYLDHIITVLRSKGLIKSLGRTKGYILSKSPDKIKLWDIVSAFEDYDLVDCVDQPEICSRAGACGTRTIWKKISLSLQNEFLSYSLQDIVEEQIKCTKGSKKKNRAANPSQKNGL